MLVTKTLAVKDLQLLYSYVSNTFPTVLNVVKHSDTTLSLSFSDSLSPSQQLALDTLLEAYVDAPVSDVVNSKNVSPMNTTSIALPANGVFTGAWQDVSTCDSLRVVATSDVSSAVGGLSMQFGLVSKQADVAKQYTLSSAGGQVCAINTVSGRFFRVVYVNGANAQTRFKLVSFWYGALGTVTMVQANQPVSNAHDCVLTRAIMNGANDGNNNVGVRLDGRSNLKVTLPLPLGKLSTTRCSPLMQVTFTYGVSSDFCSSSLINGGSVTSSAGQAVVASASAINSSASLSTNRFCRCAAGTTLKLMMACSFTAGVAGTTQIVGGGTASNGLFFGYNGTTFGVMVRSNGAPT
jgi:hypothetical protein